MIRFHSDLEDGGVPPILVSPFCVMKKLDTKKQHHGFGYFLYELVVTAWRAGGAVLVFILAVGVVFYILRFLAHLLHIR